MASRDDSFHSAQEGGREPMDVDSEVNGGKQGHSRQVQSKDGALRQPVADKDSEAEPQMVESRSFDSQAHGPQATEPQPVEPQVGRGQKLADDQMEIEKSTVQDQQGRGRPGNAIDDNIDDIGSPSDGSTPEPMPVRSSLTFASLPARDPLLTKKSMGGSRVSRTSHVNFLGRQTGSAAQPSLKEEDAPEEDKINLDNDGDKGQSHNKSSTQTLHERISMLGKIPPSRPTKSIPLSAQVSYPELSAAGKESRGGEMTSAVKDAGDSRGRDIAEKESARVDSDAPQVSYQESTEKPPTPVLKDTTSAGPSQSTTPKDSARRHESTLTSSKSKLQSIMKSARGLFTSSAAPSTAGRIPASSSPTPLAQVPSDVHEAHTIPKHHGRRTRSLTEKRRREEEQTLREKATVKEEEEEEQEEEEEARRRAAESGTKKLERPQQQALKEQPDTKHGPPSQPRKPDAADRRPVKPSREPVKRSLPHPVPIRVGSALSRQAAPLVSTALSFSAQDPPGPSVSVSSVPAASAPPASSKPTTSVKKTPSNASLNRVPSNSSMKSTMSTHSQRKAQLASERKREREEREAKQIEEQKREITRKKAAQQQQQQQQQQRQQREESQQREQGRHAEDPKRAAHMQEIEKRRLINAKRHGGQQPQGPSLELVSLLCSAPTVWFMLLILP